MPRISKSGLVSVLANAKEDEEDRLEALYDSEVEDFCPDHPGSMCKWCSTHQSYDCSCPCGEMEYVAEPEEV